jgi:ATP-dependent DNA ligase
MKFSEIKYFYPEKPVLILIESDAFQEMSDDPNWVCEPKYNGSRCEVHILDGHIEFWDRHGKHLKYNSDPLHEDERETIKEILLEKVGTKGYFVFDSELRHNKVTGIQNKLVIYDIHVYKNEVLNRMLFGERRKLLESLGFSIFNGDTVHLIYQYKDDFKVIFDSFVAGDYGDPDEFEGIVIKNLNGKLVLGRSSGTDSIWMFKVRVASGRYRY